MQIRYALIMAAGRGERMVPLTDLVPKAMAPVNGSTLIARGLTYLREKLPFIYVTVGYKGAMLAQHVIEHNVTGVFNTTGQDNAWWLFNTLMKELDEPVLVLTCDNVIELDFDLLTKEYFGKGCPPCMVVPVKPIPGLDGDYIVHENNVVQRLSRTEVTDMYCSGIQIIHPKKLNALVSPATNFYQVWNELMAQGELYCSNLYPSKWYAVDTIQQLSSYKATLGQ
ncbi:MAG TPA: NTP transferase domain-containing protein [Flavisolibacter sp.]